MIEQFEDGLDADFVLPRLMGPNCLKLGNEVLDALDISSFKRILDLGCGRGITSIRLAQRYPDAVVFAADLWIDPSENARTFESAGVADRVIPLRAEATELPFADEYFDLVVSIDAYQYFGAKAGYLSAHLLPKLQKNGRIAVAVPGWTQSNGEAVPEALRTWIKEDYGFHSAEWWRKLWMTEKEVRVHRSWELSCNKAAWDDWLRCDNEHAREDQPMIAADDGRWLATIGLTAVRI